MRVELIFSPKKWLKMIKVSLKNSRLSKTKLIFLGLPTTSKQ